MFVSICVCVIGEMETDTKRQIETGRKTDRYGDGGMPHM